MDVDISYFKELSDMVAYGAASTHGAAEQRLRMLKLKVLEGESIRVTNGDKVFSIDTLEELIDFKNKDPYLSVISLRQTKDNLKELEKLQSKCKTLEVDSFTFERHFREKQLQLLYTDGQNVNVLCDFILVKGCTFESKIDEIISIRFRWAYQDEIAAARNLFGEITGCLILTTEVETKQAHRLNFTIVCKAIEVNCT